MPGPCDGLVALVTGGSRGLGKAVAQRFAAEGATVAITARTMEPDPKYAGSLRETCDEIAAAGGTAIAVQADLSNSEEREHVMTEVVDRVGAPDILVNNAAVTFLRQLGDRPSGPPFDEFDVSAGFGMYGTCKAALSRLTLGFAAELYADGIAVNAAAPSKPVATPGAGTLDLAKEDTEDISLITETAFILCTGDPKTMTGRIAHTQPFLEEMGRLS